MPSIDSSSNLTGPHVVHKTMHPVPAVLPIAERYNLQGLEHAERREWIRALECFAKARHHHPQEPSYWLHAGEVHLHLGDLSAAVQLFHTAQQMATSSGYLKLRTGLLYHCQGQAYLDRGRYDRALQRFQLACKLFPQDPRSLVGVGLAQLGLGNVEECLGILEERIVDPRVDNSLILECLVIRAKILLDRHRVPEAYQDLCQVEFMTDGKHAEIEWLQKRILSMVVQYSNESSHQMNVGSFGVALTLVNRAIQVYPRDEHLYLQRAILYRLLGRFEDALEEIRAVTVDPHVLFERNLVYLEYAKHLVDHGQARKALETLDKILMQQVKDVEEVTFTRALGKLALGQEEEALVDFGMCARTDAKLHCARIHLRMAQRRREQGESRMALSLLDLALREDPTMMDAKILFARTLFELQDIGLARTYAEDGLALEPANSEWLQLMAQIEEYEEALLEHGEQKELPLEDGVVGIGIHQGTSRKKE